MQQISRLSTLATLFTLIMIFSGCQKLQRFYFSISGHHLLNNGQLFFWLGDTAWLLVKRNPEDVQYYLRNHSNKGFNVV